MSTPLGFYVLELQVPKVYQENRLYTGRCLECMEWVSTTVMYLLHTRLYIELNVYSDVWIFNAIFVVL
jgi:hypothetical protein